MCKAHTEVPQFNTFQAKLVNTSRGETRILKNKLDRNPRGGKIRYENSGAGKASPILYKTFLRQLREGLKHKKGVGDPEKNSNFNHLY